MGGETIDKGQSDNNNSHGACDNPNHSKTVLLTGASGFIGQHLLVALQQRGFRVISATRESGCDFRQLTDPEGWLRYLEGVDVVINCVGVIFQQRHGDFEILHHLAPAALFRACEQIDKNIRVIHVSALGADDGAASAYHRSKLAGDDALRATRLGWFVLRPSLVYGPGGRSARLFARLASFPVIPLFDKGRQPLQPVHVQDLVAVIVACMAGARSRFTLDVVGPRAVTLAQWLALVRQMAGKPPAIIIDVPFRLSLLASYFMQYLSPLLRPDNLRMLKAGNVADPAPMIELLGYSPSTLEQGWRLS